MWKLAYFETRKSYFQALLVAEVGSPEAMSAHANLKALEAVVNTIKGYSAEGARLRKSQ